MPGNLWGRHQNVPPERWSNILAFARVHLPSLTLDWASLDVDSSAHCIARKKKTTTAGLEGVTIEDLRSMCPAALTNFTSIYDQAEATGEWPTQMLAGRVTCLAKVEEPSDALDFRPITVIGILFRCWAHIMPKTQFGTLMTTCLKAYLRHKPAYPLCGPGMVTLALEY